MSLGILSTHNDYKIFAPISGEEIHKWLPNATILKYSELKNYNQLPSLPIVILYEIKQNFGHWTTVLRTPEGIEFFDSYGYAPDKELDFVPKEFKDKSDQNNKRLLHLLYNSEENINYNPHRLQGKLAATCGRWVILRNLFNFFTVDQFSRVIQKTSKQLNISPDELVSLVV